MHACAARAVIFLGSSHRFVAHDHITQYLLAWHWSAVSRARAVLFRAPHALATSLATRTCTCTCDAAAGSGLTLALPPFLSPSPSPSRPSCRAEGRTPMHWACYKGHTEVVYRLCELGANMEAVDAMRRTPLHWAARRGHTGCVQVPSSLFPSPLLPPSSFLLSPPFLAPPSPPLFCTRWYSRPRPVNLQPKHES